MTIEGQIFGQSLDLPHNWELYEGLFGLGFGNLSKISEDNKSAIDRLKDQNKIKERVFCFHLNRTTEQIQNDGGVLIIGGCDVQAEHYEPVVPNQNYWKIKMASIQVNNNEVKCENGCDAILDTGSSITRGPLAGILELNGYLGADLKDTTLFKMKNCEIIDLPDVKVKFGTFEIILKGDDYVGRLEKVSDSFFFHVL